MWINRYENKIKKYQESLSLRQASHDVYIVWTPWDQEKTALKMTFLR